jgi:hypothetical protein
MIENEYANTLIVMQRNGPVLVNLKRWLKSGSGFGYVVAGANLGYTLQRIRQDTLCMLVSVCFHNLVT